MKKERRSSSLLKGFAVLFVAVLLLAAILPRIVRTEYLQSWVPGVQWFLPSLIAILWLAAYFDLLPGVLAAVVGGLLVIAVGMGVIGPGNNDADRLVVCAGVIGTFVGMLAGVIGGQRDRRSREPKGTRSSIRLALTGVMLGSLFGFFYLWFQIMAG